VAKERTPFKLDCISKSSKLPLYIELNCTEVTWNCPLNPNHTQPDFGRVFISYTPNKKIAETKSLKFYLQSYRYKDAFNEELATRICQDLAYFLEPSYLVVELHQNSRGGIANTSKVTYDSGDQSCIEAMRTYIPKTNFRGGWPKVKEEK
jgi:7-cyano-7-deazaguanine reductase